MNSLNVSIVSIEDGILSPQLSTENNTEGSKMTDYISILDGQF